MTENIAVMMDNDILTSEDRKAVHTKDPVAQLQEEPFHGKDITAILEKHASARGGLIAILEDIQKQYGYLPQMALRIVAQSMGRSLTDVYAVATFYSSFSLKPRGRHVVCACMGTACHVRGASRIVEAFERRLEITAGETTPDKQFTLETVNCLGACALGPVVVIDGQYFSKVKKSGVRQLIDDALTGFANVRTEDDKRIFPIEVNCPHCNRSLMDNDQTISGHPAIRVAVAAGSRHGRLWRSSLYGRPETLIDHEIALGTSVNFICPHCLERLTVDDACSDCEAPMAAMIVIGGGVLKVCTRLGCTGHALDLV
jgi:NADH-quinone oxidoreductase subunit E